MPPETYCSDIAGRRIRPHYALVLAILALSACGTERFDWLDYVREAMVPARDGLTPYDKAVAELDCRAAARRHEATIIFGNFMGRETRAVFISCMEERGWRYAPKGAKKEN